MGHPVYIGHFLKVPRTYCQKTKTKPVIRFTKFLSDPRIVIIFGKMKILKTKFRLFPTSDLDSGFKKYQNYEQHVGPTQLNWYQISGLNLIRRRTTGLL